MEKIKSLEDLKKLREQARDTLKTRSGDVKVIIFASMGTVGIAAGAREVLKAMIDELETRNFRDVEIIEGGSRGLDTEEPVVTIERDGFSTSYGKVTPELARLIIAQHVVNGQIISEHVIARAKK
jgi:NADP-reducing hydrogenase subunit HndB